MASHHEPFKALGAIDWAQVPVDGLQGFLEQTFSDAQTVIDSIPSSSALAPLPKTAAPSKSHQEAATGRTRAKTESAVDAAPAPKRPSAEAEQLRKEWKHVKMNQKDSALDIDVYKLAAKDAKGAWFARRSVHEGFAFDCWKRAFEAEFAETMKVQGSPGSGNIRGIGAERRVEHHVVEGSGQVDVFQLSAQFPGPTAPRDFITLLLTAEQGIVEQGTAEQGLVGNESSGSCLRQYVIVSKPCIHPDCPPRPGIIRGQYESVEVVREVFGERPDGRRTSSYADTKSKDDLSTPDVPRAVEWLMVTRSDPGGSVPRFMIERGTPPGIVGDAAKFLKWAKAMNGTGASAVKAEMDEGQEQEQEQQREGQTQPWVAEAQQDPTRTGPARRNAEIDESQASNNSGNSGLYSIITGALGAASSVAFGLRQQFSNPLGLDGGQDSLDDSQESDSDSQSTAGGAAAAQGGSERDSDEASARSFASAPEPSDMKAARAREHSSAAGSNSSESRRLEAGSSLAHRRDDGEAADSKEVQKLARRQQRIDQDFARTRDKIEAKRRGERERDASKHERELAKHEAKYRRELRKIEAKREQQERKAEARRKKDAARQLDRVLAERDEAVTKAHTLQLQVDELQAQNAKLEARLGRGRHDSGPPSLSPSSSSGDKKN